MVYTSTSPILTYIRIAWRLLQHIFPDPTPDTLLHQAQGRARESEILTGPQEMLMLPV